MKKSIFLVLGIMLICGHALADDQENQAIEAVESVRPDIEVPQTPLIDQKIAEAQMLVQIAEDMEGPEPENLANLRRNLKRLVDEKAASHE